jgi:CDP-glucose 4,6-dehydratase
MEALGMKKSSLRPDESFAAIYQGRRVLVTGHTGFKGSWLTMWLERLGAEVFGYSLAPPTSPSHFERLHLSTMSQIGDVCDFGSLLAFVEKSQPEIVFHLAAQPLVRLSYEAPQETFGTNLMGTVNLLEVCRRTKSVHAIVAVTTDKVYENHEWAWGYRENEPLGGRDPYAASKAGADIAASSYACSYFPPERFGETHSTLLAIARAGNVIGGGDWAIDRLVPDLMRGAAAGRTAVLRNPRSTRPWEHVLEPLSGYLLLGQKLWSGERAFARAWNFGPASEGVLSVEQVAQELARAWSSVRYRIESANEAPHEAGQLTLDCTLARTLLGWRPVWDGAPCFQRTAAWYASFYEENSLLSAEQLDDYVRDARRAGLGWASQTEREA